IKYCFIISGIIIYLLIIEDILNTKDMFKKIVGLGFSTSGKNKKALKSYISGLVESGAGEFFTGYNPPYWSDKFGFEVSPNGRFAEHEQITNIETLKEIVEEVQGHGLELFVNLNAWYYTDETFPIIQKMVEEFIEIGVDGIICGNISILEYLKEINYAGKINISTILAAYNSEAIKFYLDNYKINKVILSREVTLNEIENLVKEFPEVLFEVFGEGDFCRYNNGLCYAEHKYGARDICTVVVNDLVFKKKFRADFKELILDEALDNTQKVELLNDDYRDIYQQIGDNLEKLENSELFDGENESIDENQKDLFKTIWLNRNRVDLFFDALKPVADERNHNIFVFLKGVKYVLNNNTENNICSEAQGEEIQNLSQELEKSIKSGMRHLAQKTKEMGGFAKLKALEIGTFYAKGDSLNLYNYLFFEKLHIDTVKFPTRGRNYAEKIEIIEKVLQEGEVGQKYIDRGINIERAHYDLTYLFEDKLWFRKMLQNM
ncbi:U32 family peptidase, partial [Candidatus Gracilibacteria bacterium]|nr:U32 family peptidase [Candidatus Gracilibacteria bacterium]